MAPNKLPAYQAPVSVSDEARIKQVRRIFSTITDRYDFLNHFLSAGRDIGWRRFMVRRLRFFRTHRLLDLATGTGDVAIEAARTHSRLQIFGLDFAAPMLAAARSKILRAALADRISNLQGDALNLPFPDGHFDTVTMAFGIRNMPDRARVLQEIHRALVPGGGLYILEFTTPQGRLFRKLYFFYLNRFLPRLARLFTSNPEAYQYLAESIMHFPYPDDFVHEIEQAGFAEAKKFPLTGGITYLYEGRKAVG
ncbi:MAG: bifunctional demethylmenaquinone methyltransferase/2-methoxy-6-polyprenyl-1,4-benzoquinol methylase UbiE [Deltaproteobacteria bacterium]|nr:bifunctional demethylmenaquinone methyltransferase/2-methoxy-6-polyprenyl-1,4-benzoquinol methylase UbiE [Deltaproteobacteria bacterium]